MRGTCECGSVEFESDGPWGDVTVCHCSQCRKTSGHIWASTSVPEKSLKIQNDEDLVWYESSSIARRGYCKSCGSSLFFQANGEDTISIGAGTLEIPTGLKIAKEIFEDDKGDYYQSATRPSQTAEFQAPVKGSCECGCVTLEVVKEPIAAMICHCDQCRQSSGHIWAGVQVTQDGYKLQTSETLQWYQSTDVVKKGFCNACGSTIFWWLDGREAPSISAGILDNPTGVTIGKHVFVAEKGDYYTIDDGLPQAQRFDLEITGP